MVLRIEEYSLTYGTQNGDVRILTDVTLSIARGEILGLVGESGSAKSSLANAILRDLPGRVTHESGVIALAEQPLTGASEATLQGLRGKRIAMVFQNAGLALDPVQTLGDHVVETLMRHEDLTPEHARARMLDLFATVGLADPGSMAGRFPHEASGGEKQRVVLALALACEPDLILFDEPTSALDATTAATLLDLLRDLKDRTGIAGLFISHDLGTVADIADRVAVIYGGQIVEQATPDILFANPVHPYTQALIASLPRPSDTRMGRALSATPSNAPAPRMGILPPCIYSHLCPHHDPAICDTDRVRIRAFGDRHVACARADAMTAQGESGQAAVLAPAGRDVILKATDMSARFDSASWLARVMGRAAPPVLALNGASIDLHRGETLGLVGESGCGKSTLARALAGLGPYEGAITLDGAPVTRIDQAYRARVQIVFQNPDSSLNPRHDIRTILSRPLKLYRPGMTKAQVDAEVAAILDRVRLPAEHAARHPHQLSGGEKQRVAIARAIAADPDVIICDEITSGLDASVQAAIVTLLADIQATFGTALIFITHDLAILRHIAHRIAVMYLGDIVETRATATLDARPYHPYTEALLSSSPSIDPGSTTRRVRLTGTLPTRTTKLTGCPFASRCPHKVGAICDTQTPPRAHAQSGHMIACHIPPDDLARHAPVWTFTEPAS
ncbi:ABC transporter ATP-binding protein [Jannaschia sp.]|nr:ABC transporter ATP-binding protein [Jannaschia sp.]